MKKSCCGNWELERAKHSTVRIMVDSRQRIIDSQSVTTDMLMGLLRGDVREEIRHCSVNTYCHPKK